MPRHARIDAAGALHHVMFRGIARSAIVYDAADRDSFLDRISHVFGEGRAVCYAFALLSNHAHLLIRTGTVPVTTLMRRLLTGYAVSFNRRHKRSGHLFQNRYKSILCEEEPYFLQLVRYIHLNPLRVHLVDDLTSLDSYPYAGHSAIMGRHERDWQDTAYVLRQFGDRVTSARKRYRAYVGSGIAAGRRRDLTGGGLIRSNRGWLPSKTPADRKGSEQILGSSTFVVEVLKRAKESWEETHTLRARGIDYAAVQEHVARLFKLSPHELVLRGKYPTRVTARSVFCYFLVRKLGMTATDVAKKLGMGQPAVSLAVKRGETIVQEMKFSLPVPERGGN